MAHGLFARYAYGWITLVLFVSSFVAHLTLALVQGDGIGTWAQEVFENWQSEFLQLLVQVVGLAWFLHVGSPASKEGSERLEAKVDALLMQTAHGTEAIEELDRRYMRTRDV